jgi:iron complex outermembrane receptor protein
MSFYKVNKAKTRITLILFQLFFAGAYAQTAYAPHSFLLTIVNGAMQPVDGATVKLFNDKTQLKAAVTNIKGAAAFTGLKAGDYTFTVSYTGYKTQTSKVYHIPAHTHDTLTIQPANTSLQEVSITARTPVIQQQRGKVVVDVAASVTNAGSTVLEVLEKSPGVTVDKNGGISLQGKPGVLVMIDDKPTYLSGADLNNLLTSMSSTQVAQIELIANPTAKYDASGNAGIINIKTKKNKVKGFNGSFTTSLGQGHYPKSVNSLILNYRQGKINIFFNYSLNYVKYYTDLYALRKYYDANGTLTAALNQKSFLPGTNLNNTIKTGLDYSVTDKTTIGFVLTGSGIHRKGSNNAIATWLNPANTVDSAIATTNSSTNRFKNGAVNVNARHAISVKQDLAVDIDYLYYNIPVEQTFKNELLAPGGYQEFSKGSIPTVINIGSGKADYTLKMKKDATFQLGWKSSFTNTDNLASYQNLVNNQWLQDNTKTNHFIYKEKINAAYTSIEKKLDKVTAQAGLRYEHTGYDAHQLGNAVQPDSSFSRRYGQFFPSGYISYQADSANSFTLTAGRRIDRPAFQNLNPFYFIINKYTYNTGNPFLLPQFSWNFELSHQYKNLLTTSVSYSSIKNYFSQIFLSDPGDDAILLYTQGNVGRTYNLGLSSALVVQPFNWWSVTTQAIFNHKQLRGFNGNSFTTDINQLNLNLNNQFTIAKKYTAELSGFYTTRARNDVQELLYPTGQLSVGVSTPVMGKKVPCALPPAIYFIPTPWKVLPPSPMLPNILC